MLSGVEHEPAHIAADHAAGHAPGRKGLGRATPVAIVAIALPVMGSLAVMAIGLPLAYWLRAQGGWGVVIFTVAFAILGALALAPTYSTALIAGWTFGFALGFPAVVIGTVCGALLCYAFARKYAADRVHDTFAAHPKWELIRRALAEETWGKTLWIVFLMRLSPILPFGTTNVLMATTGVPLAIYVLGTILGLMPRLGLVALAATGAERLDLTKGESWWLLGLGLGATGICIAVIALMGKHALERATRQQPGGVSAT
ncbi:MAG: hypothetical protein QOE14_1770 [Humisphaera sp.]|nr:hypothetical protein [Humisphaera sp.]